jgi:uncharacterized protein (TIGR03435 family)
MTSCGRKLWTAGRSAVACAVMLVGCARVPAQTAVPAHAQDITGQWQGTLEAGKSLRTILKISKDDGRLKAVLYSIDQGAQPINATSITLDGSTLKLVVDRIGGSYEGKLSSDGNSITGEWTQGATPLPLRLDRATKETAWEIPPPPPPRVRMPADADPTFEVATIKPNDSGSPNLQGLGFGAREFTTRNTSAEDLIAFAYSLQQKQIAGLPDWASKDRYDIVAVPDVPGAPSPDQMKSMVKKLLADRFQLKFHNDKRELSAFVLTVGKGGQKLTPTERPGPGPGFGLRPAPGGLTVPVSNATMTELCGFLQMLVLDRPVVDQTGLTGRFDFNMTFAPDDSQFNGHPPIPIMKASDTAEAPPGLFEALSKDLGLKLTPEKAQVDVVAVDHLEKPSPN